MIKVATADRWGLMRAALGALVERYSPRLQFVDAFTEGDVVLVGVDHGFNSIGDILSTMPCIAYGRTGMASHAIAMGARAFVPLTIEPDALVEVITAVARGEHPIAPELADLVAAGGPAGSLTRRELQVLELIAKGLSNHEIALQLQIAISTVDTHRGHLLTKLGLRNNVEVALFAVRNGYVEL